MNRTIHSRKAASYPQQSTPARAFVKTFALFASGILVGLLCGHTLVGATFRETDSDTRNNTTAVRALNSDQPRSIKRPRRVIKRPFLIKPNELYTVKDEATEQQYREEQANALIDGMLFRLAAIAGTPLGREPEAAASGLFLYQEGLIDGVIRTAPELADELATRIDKTLCDPKAKDSQLVSLARLIQIMPELANEKGLDCIFSGRGHKEDIVLWSMLDAWTVTGMPKTPALSQIEKIATDERTKVSFSHQEDIGHEPIEVGNSEDPRQ